MDWLEWEVLYWKLIPAWPYAYAGLMLCAVGILALWGIAERYLGRERYFVTQSSAMSWLVIWSFLGLAGLTVLILSHGSLSPSMFRAGLMMLLAPLLPVAMWLQCQWARMRVLVASSGASSPLTSKSRQGYRYVLEPIGLKRVQLHVVRQSNSRVMRVLRMQIWSSHGTSNVGVLGGSAALIRLLKGLSPGEELELITPNAGLTKALAKAVKKGLPANFIPLPTARRLGRVTLLGGRLLGGGWSWSLAWRNPVITGYKIRRL